MKKVTFIYPIIIMLFLSTHLFGQADANREVKETINLGDYTAIIYNVEEIQKGRVHNEMLLKKGDSPAMSTMSRTIELYDFNGGDKKKSGKNYMKDLNRDGINEIIVIGYTGLGKCCYQVSIHSLGPQLEEIGRFDLQSIDKFQLKDLDKDSIPEFIFKDSHFAKWNAPPEDAPMPLLIWKYDGKSYRLANYKFSNYLLKQISKKDFEELAKLTQKRADKEYNPDDQYLKYPPPKLWGIMLDYIYAGKPDKADSVFNDYWPAKIPGKDKFYQDFKYRLKKDMYRQQLESSNF